MQSTIEILAREDSAYHFLLDLSDLDPPVSSISHWHDDRWVLDNQTSGAGRDRSTYAWAVELPDGSRLIDLQHAPLLDALRRLAWSLHRDPRNGPGLSPGSASSVSRSVQLLSRWMVGNGYGGLDQLGAAASEQFMHDLTGLVLESDDLDAAVDDLQRLASKPGIMDGALAGDSDESGEERAGPDDAADTARGLSVSQAFRGLCLWSHLWRQREALAQGGLAVPCEPPFGGLSVSQVAERLATRVAARIPPLPVKVAAPVMARAYRMICTPADDVIVLQRIYLDARTAERGVHRSRGDAAVRSRVQSYTFSTPPGEEIPWRGPVEDGIFVDGDGVARNLTVFQVLRRLIRDVRDAAVITLQSSVGQRISEICGLEAGVNPATGLPACIDVRPGNSGLRELFYLKGTVAKARSAPVPAEWLIGSRLARSDHIPPPVRAVQVLQDLFEPWRALSDDDRTRRALIVSFRDSMSLPSSSAGVSRIPAEKLSKGQPRFVRDYVDLSGLADVSSSGEDLARYRDSKGTCMRAHQWRGTFARYVFRINTRLLPALSRHFHHMSLAETEQSYLGNDPKLLEDKKSAAMQKTGEFFLAIGRRLAPAVTGRFAAVLDHYRDEIEAVIRGRTGEAAQRAIENWVVVHDLRIWYHEDGKCLMRASPQRSRCHELAGTTHWSNRSPNYSARDTSVCLGCECFAIDGEHGDYWVRRYRENRSAWLAAVAAGSEHGFQAVKARADQAAAVLRILTIDLPEPEASDAA